MSAFDKPSSRLGVVEFEVCLGNVVEVSVVVASSRHPHVSVACLGTIYNPLVVHTVRIHIFGVVKEGARGSNLPKKLVMPS